MDISSKHTFSRKPTECPVCHSQRIANILYGMPLFSEKLQRQLLMGEVALGGCEIIQGDPVWRCADCGINLYSEKNEASRL